MSTIAKPRYRVPTTYAEAAVSLDEFSTEDILEYLRQLGRDGEIDISSTGLLITTSDLNRIETLALCGQLRQAQEEILLIVGAAIGRNLL